MRRFVTILLVMALLMIMACSHSAKQAQRLPTVTTTPAEGVHIGIYTSEAPGDPAVAGNLALAHRLGFDVVYNYSLPEGSPTEVMSYLNEAMAENLKVIVSLKDFYPGEGVADLTQWGGPENNGHNQNGALKLVRFVDQHPAVWGYGISDERPEAPADLAKWQPILRERYQAIKQITAKPVMATLVGWAADTAADRQAFLKGLSGSYDVMNLDHYPIPCDPVENVGKVAEDLPAVGQQNGWITIQAFSWKSYPDAGVCSDGRFPTKAEMVRMGSDALKYGAHHLMFYSLMDILSNQAQQGAVQQAVAELRRS